MDNKIQVLIVEDEALIAQGIKLTLEDFDYEVAGVCYDYESALLALKQVPFDVLLLDINLGDHYANTGLDIAEKLPLIKSVPFIFLTAFSDRQTIEKATQLKPSAYLVKPVNGPSLFAAIQTAIANFSSQTVAALPGEKQEDQLFFYSKTGSMLSKVEWSEVYAIEALKNYVKLVTQKNTSGYLIRSSLHQLLNTIMPEKIRSQYVQVNRSTALQKKIITGIRDEHIFTRHGNFVASRNDVALMLAAGCQDSN